MLIQEGSSKINFPNENAYIWIVTISLLIYVHTWRYKKACGTWQLPFENEWIWTLETSMLICGGTNSSVSNENVWIWILETSMLVHVTTRMLLKQEGGGIWWDGVCMLFCFLALAWTWGAHLFSHPSRDRRKATLLSTF